MSSKLLVYDIENIGIRGWAWGMWEQVIHSCIDIFNNRKEHPS